MTGAAFLAAALASGLSPAAIRGAAAAHPECATILPTGPLPASTRSLVPEDLVRLRDIGPAEPQYFAAPLFTLSPDGRWAAFQLRQADPQRNSYCLAMVLVDLKHRQEPRIIDEGGDPALLTIDLWGVEIPNGVMKIVTPRWSADGRWIAFLKRAAGTTQVWRSFADGSGSAQLTHSDADIVDFRIGSDGSSIVFATRPDVERQKRQIDREASNGWHYDDRFAPWFSSKPLLRWTEERKVDVLDLTTGATRRANSDELAMISTDHEFSFSDPVPGADGLGLRIASTDLMGGAKAGAFQAETGTGATQTCRAAACEGAMHPWWMRSKTHVRFLRREGWAKASTAIYDWNLKNGEVRRLYLTDDVLSSCTPQRQRILCVINSSLKPARLVQLDPVTGKRETLFDPNPEFSHLTLGKPERLHWLNAFGIESLGDLVLPVGYRPGQRYPMVVVQYDTRGFLRGGTNDEYPIQAFANRGYAVLSFSRPQFTGAQHGAKSYDEVGRKDLDQFSDHRSVESSLEEGVRLAIERGVADPKRIGITGLSDGTSTVEWALIHNTLFSAAAISSCCWEPTMVGLVGPSAGRHFLAEGYPGVLARGDPFWKQISLLENARRISTPILANTAQWELLMSVEAYTGLREAGVPIDMFVYPDEYHARWHPAHRLATYRRSLDWFDYWLRNIRSTAPDRQSEIDEWDRLRREAGHGHAI